MNFYECCDLTKKVYPVVTHTLMGYINAGVIVLKRPFYGLYLFENTYEQEPKLHNQSTVRQLSGIHSKLTRSINLNDNNTNLDM